MTVLILKVRDGSGGQDRGLVLAGKRSLLCPLTRRRPEQMKHLLGTTVEPSCCDNRFHQAFVNQVTQLVTSVG